VGSRLADSRMLPSRYKKYHKKTRTSLNFLMTRELNDDAAKTLCNLTLKETNPIARGNGPSVRVRGARENDRVLSQGWELDSGALGLGVSSGSAYHSHRNETK